MDERTENREVAIQFTGVKKRYKLGQIGGGTLQGDLQSWWARVRGKEDPNTKIGQKERLVGKTFMALNGIDLTIYKGEAVGIIGRNGAGKSTLLKLLSRVTAPTEGTIDIYGRVASMLEVGTGFNGEMTGRENIYMNGAILGMTKAEIDAKMEQIIEFSECREFIDTPVKRYSSGMYVKLAFAVAAHLDSEIMVMDEVLAVGDMKFQQKCLGKMGDAANQEGRTVLYVSHNMNTIRQLCSRCVVLDQGKIIFDGEVEKAIEVYMETAVEDRSVDIDLRESRMRHLSPIIQAKMTRVTLVGKEVPQYDFEEKIRFDLTIEARKALTALSMRMEVRSADGSSIAASTLQEFASMQVDTIKTFRFELMPKGLIPGNYTALLVIYNVNELGTYDDLDAVFPAFSFEIQDNTNALKINWNVNAWGRIRWDDITLIGERDDS